MADARSLDPLEEYDMNYKKRGLALIFNHETFNDMRRRRGSSADKKHLIQRFKEMDFDVQCHDDLRKENVLHELDKASKANHVDADCFVCVFLSHGEKDHIWAYEDKISIEKITEKFNGDNCKSLVGKPKIFIIQACRGKKYDNAVTPMGVDDEDKIEMEDGGVYTLPAGADFLMCYCVAKGYYAFRETDRGSWYIQDLCDMFRQYGQSLEFTELLTLVNRKVSMRSVGNCSDRSAIGKKQVPCFASMLTKKLYFRAKQ